MPESICCESKETALDNAKFYFKQALSGTGDVLALIGFITDYLKANVFTLEEIGVTREELSALSKKAYSKKLCELKKKEIKVKKFFCDIQAVLSE